MKVIPNLAPIDRHTIDELGIPGLLLMEEAGRQVAEVVCELSQQLGTPEATERASVVIICGGGNNGGDGFVCARKLTAMGVDAITVIHTAPENEYRGDALTNIGLLTHYPIDIIHCTSADDVAELILNASIVVDALFGSGLTRDITGLEAELIALINDDGKNDEQCVVAVDFPSGICGLTGQVKGCAVNADFTITFAAPKPGLYLPPGKSHAGHVRVVDIGIPQHLIESDDSLFRVTTQRDVQNCLPERDPDSHKYSVGCVAIVAGSRDMPGAAGLSAEAALTAGAGMVVLCAPQSVFDQLQLMPEIVHVPLPESEEGTLGPDAVKPLLQALKDKKCRAVALGPGMGLNPGTIEFITTCTSAIQALDLPLVIDADGLNALVEAKDTDIAFNDTLTILTPHVGECARLLDRSTPEIEADLLRAANDAQEVWSAHVVLKSSTVVTARRNSTLWINTRGNAGMATAGSGDVLTGIIASLAAQGVAPEQAATCGPYLHGLAGDLAADALSAYAMKASDITRYLPQAFQVVLGPDDID